MTNLNLNADNSKLTIEGGIERDELLLTEREINKIAPGLEKLDKWEYSQRIVFCNAIKKAQLAKAKQHYKQKGKTGWISVSDRLPTGQWSVTFSHWSEEVLIANSCSISIGYYDRNNEAWYVAEGAFGMHKEQIDKIRYWMPLPVNPC